MSRIALTAEVAKVLGCSPAAVRSLAKTGVLKSWKLGAGSYGFKIDEVLEYKNMKLQKLPADAISTRDAAKVLGLTMSHVRTLARKKILKAVPWGPTLAFSAADVKAYGKEKTDGRKKGKIRGALPGGFKPDVVPAS